MSRLLRGGALVAMIALAASALTAVSPPEPATAVPPTVALGGDPTFDSNSIADSTALQPHWNSYPGSRWGIGRDGGRPLDTLLSLDVNGYTNDVYRMSQAPGSQDTRGILTAAIAPPGGSASAAVQAPATTWVPSQIQFSAAYPGGDTITGGDLFTGEDSMLRYLRMNSSQSRDLVVGGFIPTGMHAIWDAGTSALYVQTIGSKTPDIHVGYVVTFYQGSATNPLLTTPTRITAAPSIGATTWHFAKNFASGGDVFISIGFWVRPESPLDGLQRSTAAMSQPVMTTALATKGAFDTILRSVPAPQNFGISGVNATGGTGRSVTAASHRSMYYRAWTFQVQQYIASQEDWAQGTWGQAPFAGPQVACGMPILKSDFNVNYPLMNASCPWDSLFGMQMLSYVPSLRQGAFDAFESMLNGIYRGGLFYGERLPSRFAQTAWILYENLSASGSPTAAAQLARIYPQLKAVLAYLATHPYWAGSGEANTASDEHDIEFVAGMLFDLTFAQKIATQLGQTSDVAGFQALATSQLADLRAWFFSDPNQIFTFYYDAPGKVDRHYSCSSGGTLRFPTCPASEYRATARPVDVPISILTALAVPNLPTDLRDRLIAYWVSGVEVADGPFPAYNGFTPAVGGAGMGWTKYPDTSLMALGAISHLNGPISSQFIHAMARDAAYAPNFSEYLSPGDGLVANNGLTTTSFSAQQLIDFTLLQNGYSIGTPGSHAVSIG